MEHLFPFHYSGYTAKYKLPWLLFKIVVVNAIFLAVYAATITAAITLTLRAVEHYA